MRKIIYAILALSAMPVLATDFTVVLPTQYEDNTALPLADIAHWNVLCSKKAGGPYTDYLGPDQLSSALTYTAKFAPATYFCVATATTVAAKGGETSDYSPEASFTVRFPKPKAVTFSIK